jgi:hypothetical protein
MAFHTDGYCALASKYWQIKYEHFEVRYIHSRGNNNKQTKRKYQRMY